IGNLTLLASRLNAKVSNGPWLGENGKRHGLEGHDVMFLNRELLKTAGDKKQREDWNDAAIRSRSDELSKYIIEIWPVPEGHRSEFSHEKVRPRQKLDLSDLLSAAWLKAGMSLFARRKKYSNSVATLLPDGRLDVGGIVYSAPSEAAKAITGKSTNGWWFFLVDQQSRRSLRQVRREYLESFAVDLEDEESGDDGDDDDS